MRISRIVLNNWLCYRGTFALDLDDTAYAIVARSADNEERSNWLGKTSLIQFIRHAKSPELPVVMLEDIAALVGLVLAFAGVGLTVITENPVFDAIGTLAIGALLIAVAVILGAETSSLLIGEGATAGDTAKIREALEGADGVESVIHMKTLYLGPDELMLAAKIGVNASASAQAIARVIDEIGRAHV